MVFYFCNECVYLEFFYFLGMLYILSYMDLINGLEFCVVCGDVVIGYYYCCMICEGCKVG